VKGSGNQQDYGFRIYDPRIGKFLSVDPITKEYPWNSPYAFAENRVIDGVDLEGREWDYYLLPTPKGPKLIITVNVQFSTDNLNLSPAEIQKYQQAIQKQFNRTLEISTGGYVSGILTFDQKSLYQSKQIVPKLELFSRQPLASEEGTVVGFTDREYSSVNIRGKDGIKPVELTALDAIHELLHTVRLQHPFERTQSADAALFSTGGGSYVTGSDTDPNIKYNIMNYDGVKINGDKLGELWKKKAAEYITLGQVGYILREIDKQKKGDPQKEGSDYWLPTNWPGYDVPKKL